jgi:hypothetical protein
MSVYEQFVCSNLLVKRPLTTQCVTSAILFASGDIIAQQAIEGKREKHDVRSVTTHYKLSIPTYFQCSFRAQHVSLFTEVTLDMLMTHFTSHLIIL